MTVALAFKGELEELDAGAHGADHAIARAHTPLLMLDQAEPYPPLAMGYTIFREPGQSPSSKFQVRPLGGPAIEYAVWYDWDIQHMYDLEHVWVYLDEIGKVIRVEASRHGKRLEMTIDGGLCRMQGSRPVLYAEAGKHAHWVDPAEMKEKTGRLLSALCNELSAWEGVHLGNVFATSGRITPTAFDHRLAKLKMKADAFEPSFAFTGNSDQGQGVSLVPWGILERWIPARIASLIVRLPQDIPHIRAVLFDCGDTIADEATEEKLPGSEVVVRAELIPGAGEMVRQVAAAGYRLALVADGPRETFENILKPAGLWDLFDAHIISGDVGEPKPSPKMYAAAFEQLGLEKAQAGSTVMIGNNLSRDIKGANAFRITSIFFGWSRRRTHEPAEDGERPDFSVFTPADVPPLLHEIEAAMQQEVLAERPKAGGAEA
ncbi:HAD family hydrolase [Chelativorans salis]|uniref:HAD family hydrolase n=1 Tax=Chelativorans salis TaxID=2978478 RepID=A0ABT2LUY7_9HYPH|nr:HAD family hydrolase [Chelativorans sp. EGI FJ00035]MCT7378196.1 HAD family hydrolase [Chelativorans sp. EGI FJ00035]